MDKINLEIEMKTYLLIFILFTTSLCAFADEKDSVKKIDCSDSLATDSSHTGLFIPWGIGEQIDYHITFGVIPAGKSRITVLDTVTVSEQKK